MDIGGAVGNGGDRDEMTVLELLDRVSALEGRARDQARALGQQLSLLRRQEALLMGQEAALLRLSSALGELQASRGAS